MEENNDKIKLIKHLVSIKKNYESFEKYLYLSEEMRINHY